MFRNILVLCTANICRSPLAEAVLRDKLGGSSKVVVHSAGTSALVGSRAHPVVVEQMMREGIDLTEHRARQCTAELLREADLVLVMEKNHLRWLSTAFPQFHGRAFLMGHWQTGSEVPDPIGQSQDYFDHVKSEIESYSDDWLARLATSKSVRSH